MTLDEMRRRAECPCSGAEAMVIQDALKEALALLTKTQRHADFYIAGPMRGYKDFNFPAFDKAAEMLTREGHSILSPAQMDRDDGFDPANSEDIPIENVIRRDINAILACRGIFLLRHWEPSVGATAEFTVGRWADKEFRYQSREEAHL